MPATIDTLRKLHDNRRWHFAEKGLQALWNEYDSVLRADSGGALSPVGAGGLVADFAPDIVELVHRSGQEDKNGVGILPPTQFRS